MTEKQGARNGGEHAFADGRVVQAVGSRPNLRLVRPGHRETGEASTVGPVTRLRMVPAPGGFAFVED